MFTRLNVERCTIFGGSFNFARVGKQYVGAVIGQTDSPRLVVKDHEGAHMDEEADFSLLDKLFL